MIDETTLPFYRQPFYNTLHYLGSLYRTTTLSCKPTTASPTVWQDDNAALEFDIRLRRGVNEKLAITRLFPFVATREWNEHPTIRFGQANFHTFSEGCWKKCTHHDESVNICEVHSDNDKPLSSSPLLFLACTSRLRYFAPRPPSRTRPGTQHAPPPLSLSLPSADGGAHSPSHSHSLMFTGAIVRAGGLVKHKHFREGGIAVRMTKWYWTQRICC